MSGETIRMPDVQIVVCPPECGGTKDLCLPLIKRAVENGGVAFMIYSEHIKEKVLENGYKIKIKYQNNVPIGLYITKDYWDAILLSDNLVATRVKKEN